MADVSSIVRQLKKETRSGCRSESSKDSFVERRGQCGGRKMENAIGFSDDGREQLDQPKMWEGPRTAVMVYPIG